MEALTCKACGTDSLLPMQVMFEEEDNDLSNLMGEEQESRFYRCPVCGDNWLSVKETDAQGTCQITFVHQMETTPMLRRVAHMDTPVVVNSDTVDHWEYYLGEELVSEEAWQETLDDRREVLRSVCMN